MTHLPSLVTTAALARQWSLAEAEVIAATRRAGLRPFVFGGRYSLDRRDMARLTAALFGDGARLGECEMCEGPA